MSNDNFSMDAFEFDESDIENLDDFITLDEDEDPDKVVKKDDTKNDGTPSDEDESGNSDADEDDNDNEDDDDGSDDTKPNLYSSLAKVLSDEGVTSHLNEDTKIDSAESLIAAIRSEVESREFEDLSDNQKYYLKALRNGVPDDRAKEIIQVDNLIDSITDDDIETDGDLRINVIKQYYIARGIDEAEATKFAQRSVTLAEDVEDAKSSLISLKEISATAKEQELINAENDRKEAYKKHQTDLANIKTSVTNIEKLIPNSNLNPKVKDELFNLVTTPVAEINGQQVNGIFKYINENPIEANIKLAYVYKITNGFTDFTTFASKKSTSNASKKLESVLKNIQTNPDIFGGSSSSDTDGYFGNDDYDIVL